MIELLPSLIPKVKMLRTSLSGASQDTLDRIEAELVQMMAQIKEIMSHHVQQSNKEQEKILVYIKQLGEELTLFIQELDHEQQVVKADLKQLNQRKQASLAYAQTLSTFKKMDV